MMQEESVITVKRTITPYYFIANSPFQLRSAHYSPLISYSEADTKIVRSLTLANTQLDDTGNNDSNYVLIYILFNISTEHKSFMKMALKKIKIK
jgi:hypothetical protein